METFIHRENVALYRKRLEEPHTVVEREVLMKLLAEEEKKLLADLAIGQAKKGHGCSC